MTDERIAAPLAKALADKGYEALTPVQESVLADGVAGRDALVSAQTGSGKTVAFGLAIAPEVLGGQERLLYADKPLALVVAPTRELALQVAREFEWLYAGTGAGLATCVGGMDYRTERRALDRGAHVVVGTPGRLRDHIERGSLDLSAIRAVVLDEADEMLDMGFREDLEFILSGAPAERRTLMFSATVPKEIADLAASYQRDALRIVAAGEARQHVDISYRAYNVNARDREHAIFNLLRYHEARTSIIFCKTRANVNHLLARMGNRGFQVVALSGELSQQERTHALQALRDGRARVCIATDVAARGIDLPGLELVIHADLPSNSEVLLHRSGRTGRAGSKGISALIVAPADFRKASRLLQGAKVTAEWGAPPSADDVQRRDDARMLDHPALSVPPGDETDLAQGLLARFGADNVAAAFIRLWREGRSAPEVLSDAAAAPDRASQPPRDREAFGDAVWFRLTVGRSGRAEARWLLPKICDAGGVAKDAIGAIRVQDDETFVQIAAALAPRFAAGAEIGPGISMTRMEGEPPLGGHGGPVRKAPPARERPAYAAKPPRIVDEADEVSVAPETVRAEAAPEAPRKPYAPRAEGDRKPYAPRAEGDRKPYAPRAEGDRKPYAPRAEGDRKPYAPRAEGDRKPYAPRAEGDRKPYAPRADADAPKKPRWGAGDKPAPARAAGFKSHAKPGDAPRAPRAAPAEDRPRRFDGDKPRGPGPKPGGDAKGKPRSAGFKSHGGGADKPARSAGFKSHAGGAKPPARPARPPADPSDTSRRFVPPKKPRG
ncbi:MAG TPA: DEAD/DEAH box helicase [Paracoccaceae bacterium]|nr:DEAD/DEAH box helicase [Paracoccaceae bacterium]